MSREPVVTILQELRCYALEKGAHMQIVWHHEDSHFVRYANSAVSLNTSENLTRLDIIAYGEKKTASVGLVADAGDLPAMKKLIDSALEMLCYSDPLSYQPKIADILENSTSESGFDRALAELSNEEILRFVSEASEGLTTNDIMLSGNFSVGTTEMATISTQTPHTVYWRATDAQVTLVLSSLKDKWEINAEQSAVNRKELNSRELRERLAFIKRQYTACNPVCLPTGKYRVVFGPAATATYLSFLGFLGLSGAALKRGYAIHKPEEVGRLLMSEKFTFGEDPCLVSTFSMPTDLYGRSREKHLYYDRGVFKGYMWDQKTADEFGEAPTGNDVPHDSFFLKGGDCEAGDIQKLAMANRDCDILYVPYLHYTGLVNPSEGLVTGTTRFGALLLKQDGSIEVPYNVRFTEKLSDLFGKKLNWLSQKTEVYNMSNSYDRRNPTAMVVPSLVCIDDMKVELSNQSF